MGNTRKAQTTLFVMLGILIVLLSAFVFFNNRTVDKNTKLFFSNSDDAVFNYVDSCLKETANQAVLENGISKEKVESYVDSNIMVCIKKQDFPLDVAFGKPKTSVFLNDYDASVKVILNVEVKDKDRKASKEEFYYKYSLSTSSILDLRRASSLVSGDRLMSFEIPQDTVARSNGNAASELKLSMQQGTPDTLSNIIYDATPDGTIFDSPVYASYYYGDKFLGKKNDLTLAYYDKGLWKSVYCLNNKEKEKLFCLTDHFTQYAVMGEGCFQTKEKQAYLQTIEFQITSISQNIELPYTLKFESGNACIGEFSIQALKLKGSIIGVNGKDLIKPIEGTGDQVMCNQVSLTELNEKLKSSLGAGEDKKIVINVNKPQTGNGILQIVFKIAGGNSVKPLTCVQDPSSALAPNFKTDSNSFSGCDTDPSKLNLKCIQKTATEFKEYEVVPAVANQGKYYLIPLASKLELSKKDPTWVAQPDKLINPKVRGFKLDKDSGKYLAPVELRIDAVKGVSVAWIEIGKPKSGADWEWKGDSPDFDQYWLKNTGTGSIVYQVAPKKDFEISSSDFLPANILAEVGKLGLRPQEKMGVAYYQKEGNTIYAAVGTTKEGKIQWVKANLLSTGTSEKWTLITSPDAAVQTASSSTVPVTSINNPDSCGCGPNRCFCAKFSAGREKECGCANTEEIFRSAHTANSPAFVSCIDPSVKENLVCENAKDCNGPLKFVLFGDSITEGHGSSGDNLLQKQLNDKIGNPQHNIYVEIKGYSAKTAQSPESTIGFSEILSENGNTLSTKKPDYVLLWFGMNDYGTEKVHADTYRDMISKLNENGITPIILSTIPICLYSSEVKAAQEGRKKFHESMTEEDKKFADETKLGGGKNAYFIDVRADFMHDYTDSTCRTIFTEDGIHLQPDGYQKFAEYVALKFKEWKDKKQAPMICKNSNLGLAT
jgi:lysophospholipase L1-like esterase